jgi:hypothetical protein
VTIRRSTTPARLEPAERTNDCARPFLTRLPGQGPEHAECHHNQTSLFIWAGPREDIDRRQRCRTEMVQYNAMLAEVPDTWPLPT